MIALMGAAGNVGGKVADLLLQQDQDCACSSTADAAFVLLPDNLDAPDFVANRSRMSQAITYPLGETGVGTSSP
jgi:nucleoside-diphosphate-sugar epimerase